MAKKNIVIIGPPNSGKGTHSKTICEKYGVSAVSTGNLFRENIAKGTKLGKKAKKFMDKGKLVPDKVTINMVKNYVEEVNNPNGLLFDGFPRSFTQAKMFVEEVGICAVIYLSVPDEVVIARSANRMVCNKCQDPAIKGTDKASKPCTCGGTYIVRDDDNEETMKKRLVTYKEQTAPVVEFFRGKKNCKGKEVFVEIDASGAIDVISKAVMKALDDLFVDCEKKHKAEK